MNFRIERRTEADSLPVARGVLELGGNLEPVATAWRSFWGEFSADTPEAEPEIASATLTALEAFQTGRAKVYKTGWEATLIPSFVPDMVKKLNEHDATEHAKAVGVVSAHFSGGRPAVVAFVESAHPDGRVYSVRFNVNDYARGKRFGVQYKQGTETVYMTDHPTHGAAVHAIVKHLHECRRRLDVLSWEDKRAGENYDKLGRLDTARRRRQEDQEAVMRERLAAEREEENTARFLLETEKLPKFKREARSLEFANGPAELKGYTFGRLFVHPVHPESKQWVISHTLSGCRVADSHHFGPRGGSLNMAKRVAVWLQRIGVDWEFTGTPVHADALAVSRVRRVYEIGGWVALVELIKKNSEKSPGGG